MYVHEPCSYRNGKVYRQVGVRPSDRVAKKGEEKELGQWGRLPVETQKLVRGSVKRAEACPPGGLTGWDEAFDDGGLGVREEVSRTGILEAFFGVARTK